MKEEGGLLNAEEYKKVSTWLKEMSRNAIEDNFNKGIPVTILLYGDIYKIYPDGTRELIKKLNHQRIKVEKREYKL
jgi:hypothetical protein